MATLSHYVVVVGAIVATVYWFTSERSAYQALHKDVQSIKETMATKEDMKLLLQRFDRIDARLDTLNNSVLVTRAALNIPSFIKDTLQLHELYVQLGKR